MIGAIGGRPERSEVRAMAKGRDRPRKEPKRKAKEKAPKQHPIGSPGWEPPRHETPSRPVEVIKPKRKEREREPQDEE
jgi:hypothetical protein